MEIAILLFTDVTALDAIGPYEVLSRIPNSRVKFVAAHPGPIKMGNQMCTLMADFSLLEVPQPDVIVIPGGWGTEKLMKDPIIMDWIRKTHVASRWTTSVCTGSLLLASAGVLKDKEATSHWTTIDQLSSFGAIPTQKRVVKAGKIVTSAGVSAGIDMALQLAAWIGGEDLAKTIQLSLEYDPEPPFEAGSPKKAGTAIVENVRKKLSS